MKIALPLSIVLAVFLGGASPAEPANLSGIRDLVDKGRNQAAIQQLTALTEKEGEDHEAWALLAECRLAMKDLDGAVNAVSAAIEIATKTIEEAGEGSAEAKSLAKTLAGYWLLLGRVSFNRGEQAYVGRRSGSEIKSWFADAEMKFREARTLEDDNVEVRWRMGWAKEFQEYPEKAKELYREQIAKFPNDPAGYRRLGVMLSTKSNSTGTGVDDAAKALRQKALDLFNTGLEKAGPDAEIIYFKGLALEWNRKKDEARECYIQAVKADPELYKAWQRLYEIGARADLLYPLAQSILKKRPNTPTAAMWAGFFLIEQRKFEEALDILLTSLKVYREHGGCYQQAFRAASSILRPKPAVAIEAFKTIHECYPWLADAANNVGLFYRDSGAYEDSLKWYLLALEREPTSQDILNDTGLMYLFHTKGDRQKKCLPLFEMVIDQVVDFGLKPERGYWDALENLCKYYYEVEKNLDLVIKYGKMRYETTLGVAPYNMSNKAAHYKQLAERDKK